jgi:hypothetical protein
MPLGRLHFVESLLVDAPESELASVAVDLATVCQRGRVTVCDLTDPMATASEFGGSSCMDRASFNLGPASKSADDFIELLRRMRAIRVVIVSQSPSSLPA